MTIPTADATALPANSAIGNGLGSEGTEPMDWIRVDPPGRSSTTGRVVTTSWYGLRISTKVRTGAGTTGTDARVASSARELRAEFRCTELWSNNAS